LKPLSEPWSATPDGLVVAVKVIPKSSRDEVAGVDVDESGRAVLKVRLTTAPTDGKANAALCAFLAKPLDVPKSAVQLQQGHKSRIKRLLIAGDGAALLAKARALNPAKPE
jgi:uncharacterized protein (TIGR00251 family)